MTKKNKYIGNQIIDRTFRCMLAPNETGEGIRGSLPQTFFLLLRQKLHNTITHNGDTKKDPTHRVPGLIIDNPLNYQLFNHR